MGSIPRFSFDSAVKDHPDAHHSDNKFHHTNSVFYKHAEETKNETKHVKRSQLHRQWK